MELDKSNKIVHGLWIGTELSLLELLTIKSFLSNGHTFYLWVYYQLITPIPEGVFLKDANEIIPENKIFRYKNKDQFGHGQGSLAGFSDIFRYKLLYEYGGWWVDMDVTCLKPFDFQEPYVFRPHHDMPVVGNIMKCPARSPLMQYCYQRASREVDENNHDWHLPIQILNDGIVNMGLSHHIRNFTNPESWYENRKMIMQNVEFSQEWYAIHWINEEWRRNGINKNYAFEGSTLHQLFKQHGFNTGNLSYRLKMLSWYRLKIPFHAILRAGIIRTLFKKWWSKIRRQNMSGNEWHCPYMQNHFMVSFQGDMGYCRPHLLEVSLKTNEFSWDSFFKKRDTHREDLLNNKLGKCSGCTYLTKGGTENSVYKFNFLDLVFSSFCNLRCIYCYINKEDLGKRAKIDEQRRLTVLKEILERKMLNPSGGVSFSGGEPTISTVFEEACTLIWNYSKEIYFVFVTNCTFLSPMIVEIMKSQTTTCLMISLDSAEDEMFLKIKGKNLFSQVIKNLKEYLALAETYPNNHVFLKFIMLEENIKAIPGFLDLAGSLGFKRVFYDIDNRTTHNEKQLETVIPAAITFCNEAVARGIEPIAESTGLSRQDLKDRINLGHKEFLDGNFCALIKPRNQFL